MRVTADPRDIESALLTRCAAAAQGIVSSAQDQREANVFGLASRVIQSRFPCESTCLKQAGERYFASHPNERLASAEVIREGWVQCVPRFRDMLIRQFEGLL